MTTINKHEPHVFEEVDLLPFSPPLAPRGPGNLFVPPATPAGQSLICGICSNPRSDRIHIDGEAQADAESPKWG
jgi:hypothetical protein